MSRIQLVPRLLLVLLDCGDHAFRWSSLHSTRSVSPGRPQYANTASATGVISQIRATMKVTLRPYPKYSDRDHDLPTTLRPRLFSSTAT
ncbi:hypothetical protein OH76DRAFT_162071 [Lentinus brumalis]|uniref:Secreted protein n=1 Tax=Lentinus brumalis TaxID=2498619 RepID=A0A371DIY3_9APHY|nr:hypothetical protein OH76DRAFT_162071 [Polyporus brumalis]